MCDRPRPVELDVRRRRVPQRDAVLQRPALDLESEQRRVLQLAEGPLGRERDERQLHRPEDRHGVIGRGQLQPDLVVAHEQALAPQLLEQAGGADRGPLVGEARVDLSVQDAVAPEDEAARVAVRGRVACGDRIAHCGCASPSGSAGGAGRRNRSIRLRARDRKKNGTATMAAMKAWTTRLPDPGSM